MSLRRFLEMTYTTNDGGAKNKFVNYKLIHVLHFVVILFDSRIAAHQYNNTTVSFNESDTVDQLTKAPLVDASRGFQEAARILLANMNLSVDPCDDFYRFSCDNYAKNSSSEDANVFVDTQLVILDKIAEGVARIDSNSTKTPPPSYTERIAANVFKHCRANADNPVNHTASMRDVINELFGGFPAVDPNWKYNKSKNVFRSIGELEKLDVPTLFEYFIFADEKNVNQNALHFFQFPMIMPHDFYVKPQFSNELKFYLEILVVYATIYAQLDGSNVQKDQIRQKCQRVVDFEIRLASATVSSDLLRNHAQRYNKYNQSRLEKNFPNIEWSAYFDGLNVTSSPNMTFILINPSYFTNLQRELATVDKETLVNLAVYRFIMKYSEYFNNQTTQIKQIFVSILRSAHARRHEILRFVATSRRNTTPNPRTLREIIDVERQDRRHCALKLMNYMPHAAAYVYLKDVVERDAVKADIRVQLDLLNESFLEMASSVSWITANSLNSVRQKSENLVKNVGWPSWFNFKDNRTLDDYHVHYRGIENETEYLRILWRLQSVALKIGFDELSKTPCRHCFLLSAATANAFYLPHYNSVTIPYGIFNPPFYRLDFPEYFNYAALGGTVGHELSHAFDDEGVQFGPTGELSDCRENRCSWMDQNSTRGFLKMTQCVIQQYSSSCCPINKGPFSCVNGVATQGENIADIAGQQTAYRAYRKYVRKYRKGVEESRLPGLEKFTPNQLFWIAYAGNRCTRQTQISLLKDILTGSHAPYTCRVNQVVRNIPEFVADFGCAPYAPMFLAPKKRCAVWVDNGERKARK